MNLQTLQEKLHNKIPMTKLMKLELLSIDENFFTTKAPLNININDKGTAFGGSLSSITIISAWSLVELLTDKLGFKKSKIAIILNETKFKAPVTKDIICKVFVPNEKTICLLKDKLANKKSGSIKIFAQILEDGKVCVDFTGVYVVKV